MIEPGANGNTATSDALAGSAWEILSVDGVPVEGGDPVLISFGHDGRVSGSTGVNHLTASYSVTDDYLTFGPLATSRRSAPADLLDQEHRIVASLAGMCSFRLGPRTFSFDGPLGRVELCTAPGAPARAREPRSDLSRA